MNAAPRLATIPADFCYPPGLISVEQARTFLLERARPARGSESVDIVHTLGRVLARDVESPIDVPGFDNSQMDGYAVRAADLSGDGEVRLRVAQRIVAGTEGVALGAGEAARIFTGAPVPPGADTVVMQERCRVEGDTVALRGPVPPGDNVRPRGNDIVAGTRVLSRGARLRPQEMGLLASLGLARAEVRPRLRVAVFSSGDELLAPGEPLTPGRIYNSNRYTLGALVQGLGLDLVDLGRVADTFEATRDALAAGAGQADVVVSSGGVSVGDEDHVKAALESIGSLDLWRVAVKPGKPLAFGRIGDADFLGLPGNPVSTLVTFCIFVRPFLLRRQGATEVVARPWTVRAGFDWATPRARREFARARLVDGADGVPAAELHPRQGSDVLTSTVWAEGLAEIPEGATLSRGDGVAFHPFSGLLG